MVTAVVIELYFHIWLPQFPLPSRLGFRQAELHVLDIQTALYPHLLVISLDREDATRFIVDVAIMIEVGGGKEHGQMVLLCHIVGIGEQKVRISLHVNDAAIDEETAIAL